MNYHKILTCVIYDWIPIISFRYFPVNSVSPQHCFKIDILLSTFSYPPIKYSLFVFSTFSYFFVDIFPVRHFTLLRFPPIPLCTWWHQMSVFHAHRIQDFDFIIFSRTSSTSAPFVWTIILWRDPSRGRNWSWQLFSPSRVFPRVSEEPCLLGYHNVWYDILVKGSPFQRMFIKQGQKNIVKCVIKS